MRSSDWRSVAHKDYGIMHDEWHINPELVSMTSKKDKDTYFEWLRNADRNGDIFLVQRRVPDTSVFELLVIPRVNRG